ncbi:uncharacterized protein [Ptychodera flava]|uniref:uncharacterized protein isoform X2 n=1 Tax=Ptychodera flava TaxID=63121 RepID=UPI00396A4F89
MTSMEAVISIALASTLGISLAALAYVRRKSQNVPLSKIKFGKEMRKAEFFFYDDITPCNHGSFGAVPKQVFDARYRFLVESEQNPDLFQMFNCAKYHQAACVQVAQFVGADTNDIVFIPNVTTAISTVLNSLRLAKDDKILTSNVTYPSMVNAADAACEMSISDARVLTLNVRFPINSKEEFIQNYRDILSSNSSIKIAIIDHITSSTALVIPIKELIKLCREIGVQTFIDGAHAPGQIALNIEELQPDYYTGDLHKWLYTPRGAAFLWINPKHHNIIKPLVTSHNCKQSMQKQFFQRGTQDNSTYLSAPAAIKFYTDIGGMGAIHEYTNSLLEWGIPMLAEAWGTETLAVPANMMAPNMRLVRLPTSDVKYDTTDQWAIDILANIYDKHRVLCAPVEVQCQLWCRVSVNIYNTKEDLMHLRDAVLDVF